MVGWGHNGEVKDSIVDVYGGRQRPITSYHWRNCCDIFGFIIQTDPFFLTLLSPSLQKTKQEQYSGQQKW